MARCLIIGCGCRGISLAHALIARGHAVRGTTRSPERFRAIARSGAEPVLADPDRVGTLAPALEQVTVACLLLGSAVGAPEQLAALHGSRLEMLLTRMLDTTVRAIVYEAAGAVDPAVLREGADRVGAFCEDSRIPYRVLRCATAEPGVWLDAALSAVIDVLEPGRAA